MLFRSCTDSLALNFNPVATKSNGRCIYNSTIVLGCKSPKALNFNPKATHEDGSCVFARPVNIVIPFINKELIVIADTLGKVLQATCNFDYSIPIDTVYIVKAYRLDKYNVEIDWAIKQGALITNIKTAFMIQKEGIAMLYLSLICNQGIVASNSGTPSKVSSVGTELVKGVTISALFSNKFVTGIDAISGEVVISIYPNPVNNKMNITYYTTDNESLQLNVYSIEGRRIISNKVSAINGLNQFEVNTASLNSGLNYLTIQKDGVIFKTLKFSKF